MRRSYKYKLRLNRSFLTACEEALESCRFVYNSALSQRISHYRQGRSISFPEQSRQLTDARELPEVGCVLRSFQLNALRQVEKAYQGFFRRVKTKQSRAGFPRFKSRDRFGSFSTWDGCQFRLDGDKLTISKLGSCRVRLSRPLEGRPKTCTICREADGWYVAIACEVEPAPLQKSSRAVGIDVGLENFVTLSDGGKIENPRFLDKGRTVLALAQQRLARKKRNSTSRRRAKELLARAYLKTRRQRDWFHWQVTRNLTRRYGRIAVEKLNVKGMAQSSLTKSIHDVGWALFITKLASKAEEAGRELIKVPARFTSQDCSGCGLRKRKDLSERWHSCPCGTELDRDVNAARNILARAWPDLKIEPYATRVV